MSRPNIQFRAEFFNQVNFSNPVNNHRSSIFGGVQVARDGRTIQFGLKALR